MYITDCQISVYYYDIILSLNGLDSTIAHLNTEISPDGSWSRVSRVGGSQHNTASLDSIESLPDHGNHGAARIEETVRRELLRSDRKDHPSELSGKIISSKVIIAYN